VEDRNSESLEIFVATEYSGGKYDMKQLTEAYIALGLSPYPPPVDATFIEECYNRRVQDSSPLAIAELRKHLGIIGQHLSNDRLRDIADDCESMTPPENVGRINKILALETYEQALAYLDVEKSTPNEFLITMYSVKVSRPRSSQMH